MSIVSLLIMSLFLSLIITTLFLSRKASGMLFHLVLSSSFHSPLAIRYVIHAVGDVTGPFLCCVIYSIIHSNKLRFPMNASFFFPLAASGCLLAYTLSLFLIIQFRGDYGVMNDYQELKALLWKEKHDNMLLNNTNTTTTSTGDSISSNDSNGNNGVTNNNNTSGKFSFGQGLGLHQRFGNAFGFSNTPTSTGGKISPSLSVSSNISTGSLDWSTGRIGDESLFAIPLGDISLLFSSMGQGYGSKLYNLKNDFKDV